MPFILNFEPSSDEQMAKLGAIAVDAVAAMNVVFLQEHPQYTMPVWESGVLYDPPPVEYRSFTHGICGIPIVMSRGVAKCDSITAWDVAWRRMLGQNAYTGIIPQGGGLYHVVTFVDTNGDVQTFDASKSLGKFTGNGCLRSPNDITCMC